jgi:MFS superfamily sulfate permease-like transporter
MTMNWARLRDEWLGNIRGDLLAGIVVALALIPYRHCQVGAIEVRTSYGVGYQAVSSAA